MDETAKALVVVQARYNSSRLPGKALYPLSGIPMIVFLLRRLKTLLPVAFRLILATGRGSENDPLSRWAEHEGVKVFRGPEADVVERFFLCLNANPADVVVRVTGDNPLTCPDLLAEHARWLEAEGADYVQFTHLPFGAGTDVFSSQCIRRIHEKASVPDEREHLNLYVLNNEDQFSIRRPRVRGTLARPELRMTVDTKEDWERMNRLVMKFGPKPWRTSLASAIEYLAP